MLIVRLINIFLLQWQ